MSSTTLRDRQAPTWAPALAQRLREAPASETVRIADAVAERRRAGERVLDFSAGRPAEHTPAFVVEAAVAALAAGDTHQTMARGRPDYREACSNKLFRENAIAADPDTEIVATLGVKHGMLMALLASIDPGDEVIVEDPCFVSYAAQIRWCGGVPRPVPLRAEHGFRWMAAEIEAAVTPRTRAILFCSPHNPVGSVHRQQDLDVIAEVAERRSLLVIADETYERLTWNGRRHVSIASLPRMQERTVTLMGLTKAFAMGGFRVGFASAPPPLIEAMVTVQQHLNTCVSSFAQAAATVALREPPPQDLRDLWRDWERRCAWAAEEIARIPGAACAPPEGGFYAWIDVRELASDTPRLAQRLLEEHHLALVPGDCFGDQGRGFLRMTCVRSWEELREGVALLKKALPEVARG